MYFDVGCSIGVQGRLRQGAELFAMLSQQLPRAEMAAILNEYTINPILTLSINTILVKTPLKKPYNPLLIFKVYLDFSQITLSLTWISTLSRGYGVLRKPH